MEYPKYSISIDESTAEPPKVSLEIPFLASDIHLFLKHLENALQARVDLHDPKHQSAFRLYNGFYEGFPDLVIDVYARTFIIYNYAAQPESLNLLIQGVLGTLQDHYPWLRAVIMKPRKAPGQEIRHGRLLLGDTPDDRVQENAVSYALNLLLDKDASFYPDTRNLRKWALENLTGVRVLNAFAYTGSLGVAARAGGAQRVVHIDLSRKALDLAKTSYDLNGLTIEEEDFLVGDFWVRTNQLKRSGNLFECVFVDPPFFSITNKGRVDLVTRSARLINKVRPLVSHGGYLVFVNNALFVSGAQFISTLESLCSTGYLSIEELIPVPDDITGYSQTRVRTPPTDPAPFNHPTKIAVLKVYRKDRRTN